MYSIASARKRDGSIDKDTVMVRARCVEHLRNFQGRFSALADAEMLTLPERDYRYRLIVPKRVWASALAEMAEEQKWALPAI
jgi:late competence protein required for DNA uptake (superfamily II DNA/RNA helicase)